MADGATAALNLLNKMMDAEPNGELEVNKLKQENDTKENGVHLVKRKHFRISQTLVTEGDMTENNDKEETAVVKTEVKKHKKWNCFGGCTGK